MNVNSLRNKTELKSTGHGVHEIICIINKGNNKITELRTILQRESQNS